MYPTCTCTSLQCTEKRMHIIIITTVDLLFLRNEPEAILQYYDAQFDTICDAACDVPCCHDGDSHRGMFCQRRPCTLLSSPKCSHTWQCLCVINIYPSYVTGNFNEVPAGRVDPHIVHSLVYLACFVCVSISCAIHKID